MLRGVIRLRSYPRFGLRADDSVRKSPLPALRARTSQSMFAGSGDREVDGRRSDPAAAPLARRAIAGPLGTRRPDPPVRAGEEGAGWWSDPGPGPQVLGPRPFEEWASLDGKRR